MVTLRAGEHELLLDQQYGGRILEWRIAGVDVLAPAGDHPIRGGMYVMAPWVGRLKNAAIDFNGNSYPQPQTYQQWAIHGSMPFSTCEVQQISEDEAIVHHTTPQTWPVEMQVKVTWKVTESGLFSTAEISVGEGEFPAAIGWHPWFLKTLSNTSTARYGFDSNQQFKTNDDFIVTGEIISKTAGPHDDSFIVPTKKAEIIWTGFRSLTIETSARYFHLFETEKLVCIEPETSPPNGVNLVDLGFSQIVSCEEPLRAHANFVVQNCE